MLDDKMYKIQMLKNKMYKFHSLIATFAKMWKMGRKKCN